MAADPGSLRAGGARPALLLHPEAEGEGGARQQDRPSVSASLTPPAGPHPQQPLCFSPVFCWLRHPGDQMGECRAHGNLGSAFFSKGNYREALSNHRHQLMLAMKLKDREVGAGGGGFPGEEWGSPEGFLCPPRLLPWRWWSLTPPSLQ